MRSTRGVLAAAVLLLAIPITVLVSNLTGVDDEVVIHVCFAAGVALLAFALPDFKLAGWITRVGCLAMAGLAVIFSLQALSSAVNNQTLDDFAYDILGQGLESVCIDVFLIWCVGMLLNESQGKTRLFGSLVVSLLAATEIYRYTALLMGGEAPEALKLLLVPVIVWFLLESRAPTSREPGSARVAFAPTA